jgi:hypothetical protein
MAARSARSNTGRGYAAQLGWDYEQYDQDQLTMGIEVELEHTPSAGKGIAGAADRDLEMALDIATDHLAEQVLAGLPQDYYTRLKGMESDMHPNAVRPNSKGAQRGYRVQTQRGREMTEQEEERELQRAIAEYEGMSESEKRSARERQRLSRMGFAVNPSTRYDEESLLRDVRLEVMKGRVFRLRMWDSGGRDERGVTTIAYRFEQTQPKAEAGVIFEDADFHGSPMHADDSDETVRGLLTFLTLKPGDTDKEYFDDYTEEQMAFAMADGESLSMYSFDEKDMRMPLRKWRGK